MDILSKGCKSMDDDQRSRLAIKLASCHLEKSGFETYRCTNDMSIRECTSKMDQIAFVTYTNFYISTENICYYLQSEVFQLKTEDTVNKLVDTSIVQLNTMNTLNTKSQYLSDTLDQTFIIQKRIESSQNNLMVNIEESKDMLNKISDKSDQLSNSIKDSSLKQDQLNQQQEILYKEHQNSIKMIGDIKNSAEDITKTTCKSLEQQNQIISLQTDVMSSIKSMGEMSDIAVSKLRDLIQTQESILDGNKVIVMEMEILVLMVMD
eukprot:gene4337-5428_t